MGEFLKITFDNKKKDLNFTIPKVEGKMDENFEMWYGKYNPFMREVYVYGNGKEFENWLWIVLHETLHDTLTTFIYGGFVNQDEAEEQEYIIDLILKDLGFV